MFTGAFSHNRGKRYFWLNVLLSMSEYKGKKWHTLGLASEQLPHSLGKTVLSTTN